MKVVTAKNLLTDPVAVLAGIGCLGVLVLAGLGLSGPKGKPTAAYTHLHCPSCKVEIAYSAEKDGQRCKACLAGASFVPTVGPFQETGSMDASGGGRNWGRVVRPRAVRRARAGSVRLHLCAAAPGAQARGPGRREPAPDRAMPVLSAEDPVPRGQRRNRDRVPEVQDGVHARRYGRREPVPECVVVSVVGQAAGLPTLRQASGLPHDEQRRIRSRNPFQRCGRSSA